MLQPRLKKKKSVTKLEVKDTKEASKYMLTHQEQDSNGEMETRLIKVCIIHEGYVYFTNTPCLFIPFTVCYTVKSLYFVGAQFFVEPISNEFTSPTNNYVFKRNWVKIERITVKYLQNSNAIQ